MMLAWLVNIFEQMFWMADSCMEVCFTELWNFAADFSSFIVEVFQITTAVDILIPILRKLGAA